MQEIYKVDSQCLWLSVIDNIRELAGSFISCSFQFVRRYCNRLAHMMAHQAICDSPFKAWIKGLPDNVSNLNTFSFEVFSLGVLLFYLWLLVLAMIHFYY